MQAARLLDVNDLGVIREGAIADLVILNQNPLQDIGATKQIFGIFLEGKWFNRTALDIMEKRVKESIRQTGCK